MHCYEAEVGRAVVPGVADVADGVPGDAEAGATQRGDVLKGRYETYVVDDLDVVGL